LALAGAAVLSVRAETSLLPPAVQTASLALPAQADVSLLANSRWKASLDAFATGDQQQHPAGDGVLFVGSSTIRLWSNLQQDFREVPVIINRGFGGSTMRDCNSLVRELVIQYKPKQVMVYAGDNDLAEGRTPEDVLGSLQNFVRKVHAALPGTRISYISIKPSPERIALLPQIRQTNALIAGYVQSVPGMRYIDIFNPMLGANGLPRPELFRDDRLHLSDAGYRLWQSVIAADLAVAPALAQQQATAVGKL
jgi:lysophospholipase L1-like esterase